jgi:type II secretory pathway component GspD/PulD (secretin)
LDIGIEGAWGHTYNGTNDPVSALVGHAFGVSPVGSVFSPTNLNSVGQQIGNFAPNPPGAGLYQILGADYQVTLRAIAQSGKAQLLSRPSILARDRQPATIQVGQRVPLVTSVNVSALGNQNNGVTYTDVGIILRVTPYITPDGMVQMVLAPETSALDQSISIPISPGVSAPVINIRYADTVAITPDGQTVVIGGLMATDKAATDSKIPFLGDIPVIGNLFKRQTKTGTKRELLIFLTPHIVRDEVQLAQMSTHEEGTHNLIRKSVSEDELDKFLDRLPVKQDKDKEK